MKVLGIVVVIAIVVIVGFALFTRSRRADGMTSFQRQIDALSPEARRPTVDKVQRAAQDDRIDPRTGKRSEDRHEDGSTGDSRTDP